MPRFNFVAKAISPVPTAAPFVLPSRGWMLTYRLEAKVAGKWERVCEIEADSHRAAFRKAMVCLPPKHYQDQIRLVQIKLKRTRK